MELAPSFSSSEWIWESVPSSASSGSEIASVRGSDIVGSNVVLLTALLDISVVSVGASVDSEDENDSARDAERSCEVIQGVYKASLSRFFFGRFLCLETKVGSTITQITYRHEILIREDK